MVRQWVGRSREEEEESVVTYIKVRSIRMKLNDLEIVSKKDVKILML